MRKTVTVLFCDVVGSTALGESVDPEALQAVLARYFERMKAIVERHGGGVEKFIGDAVMAVFGVPLAHEDDALRALRAAVEMRGALPALGVRARIGVNTGEVITGTGERLVTGDAVNVAARLQQAAEAGDILFGKPTHELVGGSVEADVLTPLNMKGKQDPVAAYRLLRILPAPERRDDTRFVGRQRELGALRQAWEGIATDRRCELVTVVADAGMGKSRLVAEFLGSIDAHVVRGRCLSYGEGITYWPVVEVLKQLRIEPDVENARVAIRSLLDESTVQVSTDEIAWAVRKTFELGASKEPLVVVFDDIQWGEETFLDLIEHVALMSAGAPILILCMARPELLERRPRWPSALRLAPLSTELILDLMPPQLDQRLRDRITQTAGGNPLFVTEMVAMSSEAGADVVVPPTLKALLAARLDQLDPDERRLLERASVEGEVFHRGAVQALGPEEPVLPRLSALMRKEIIRPETPQVPGEDGYRFRHLLIRDTAYEALSKRERAQMHERFASWLADRGRDLVELDEVLGYHLEQAWRYSSELGIARPELRAEALRRARTAEQQAMNRQDYRAARKLAARALALVPEGELDAMLEIDRLDSSAMSGDVQGGLGLIAEARERAARTGLRAVELSLLIGEMYWKALSAEGAAVAGLQGMVDQALPELESARHDLGLYLAYLTAGHVAVDQGKADVARTLMERALAHAEALPPHCVGFVRRYLIIAWDEGSATCSELIAWLDRFDAEHVIRMPNMRRYRAMARLGRTDEARGLAVQLRRELRERGNINDLAQSAKFVAEIELMAQRPEAAEEVMSEGLEIQERQGARAYTARLAAHYALVLCELRRFGDADQLADRTEPLADPIDVPTQALWHRARTRINVARGELVAAEDHARQAVENADRTDDLNARADAHGDLAEALVAAERMDDALDAYAQALVLYDRKENVVMAGRVRGRLEALRAAPAS